MSTKPNIANMIANAATRRLSSLFPGYFNANPKRDIYQDYGYPDQLCFDDFYKVFRRNGIATAALTKTKLKTWQDYPEIWESEEAKESELEKDIRQKLEDIRFWQCVSDADLRSMVGGYAGLIFRFRDNKRFDEPVDRVPGGLDGLAEVIPAWKGQLEVSTWDTDANSETYGKPLMYVFNEAAIPDGNSKTNQVRQFKVHPDRVLIWSKDGTINPQSDLEPGYNALLDIEKIAGAGGEGFWKTARAALALEIDKEARADDMAAFMGVDQSEIADKLDDSVKDFMQGFDASLLMQGMKANPISVNLPSPEYFFANVLNIFASSICIPAKILIGMQTGERASKEDADEWAQTNMSRRTNICRPNIRDILNRLEKFQIIPEKDWTIEWTDLTEASMSEKIDRADKMASINQRAGGHMGSEIVFTPDEIRETLGMKPLSIQMPDEEDGFVVEKDLEETEE